jgi:hypothetical protein
MDKIAIKRGMGCTCGNHVNEDGNSISRKPIHNDYQLDSSFVHLPPPPPSGKINGSSKMNDSVLFNHGFLSAHKYMLSLLQVTEDSLRIGSSTSTDENENHVDANEDGEGGEGEVVHLCHNCIQRINNAINDNTEQLQMETHAYIHAVEEEKDKERRLKKALLINIGIHNNNDQIPSSSINDQHDENELVQGTIQSFQHEIMNLQTACQEHENELTNLNQMLMEQAQISDTLSAQQEELLLEYNALEKDAKVFEDVHSHLTQQCHAAESERSHLSHVRLHSALFDIVVDERGTKYPLINNLRLSHRPKDDLQWIEINTAWSQAAQLVMFVNSTTKFTSRNFGIVPLMHCAKIIEVDSTGKKVYHHLGVDFESMDRKTHNTDHIIASLRAFYSVLYQLFDHIKALKRDINSTKVRVPFEMTVNTIGSFNLQFLNENDDKAWSGVINCIASNLKWLSYLF